MPPKNSTMKYEINIDWDDLLDDLKHGQTILVIGPDFLNYKGGKVKPALLQKLLEAEDHGVEYFYADDGMFLFNKPKHKAKAQKAAAQFYSSLEVNESLLQKIVELPFSLIINTNPDKSIERKYRENDISCQFDFFSWKPNQRVAELSKPHVSQPIVFNMFGSVESNESIILDFEDTFDHLRKLLNDVNISDVIRTALNETYSYIFIGFELESWHTQLIFRYLNMKEHHFDDKNKNYADKPKEVFKASAMAFVQQQFNIRYYEASVDFLNTLHEKYFANKIDETNEVSKKSPRSLVEQHLMNNEIQKALKVLEGCKDKFNEEFRDGVILLTANYVEYRYREAKNIEEPKNLELRRAQIRESILQFSKTIPE